jgi:hypothetical protein
MHWTWRPTTYLYSTAALIAALVGSPRDILVAVSLTGVLAVQAAMHRRLTIPRTGRTFIHRVGPGTGQTAVTRQKSRVGW